MAQAMITAIRRDARTKRTVRRAPQRSCSLGSMLPKEMDSLQVDLTMPPP